ncbi:MAG TPA: MtrB/PioB family outer membrane beta-barrel protein [Gemmatimonadaceae bacterium]|nr:MtrB/PioB family outer membrane beta-barrel protein [Gemmatimonadaceae bacterium]
MHTKAFAAACLVAAAAALTPIRSAHAQATRPDTTKRAAADTATRPTGPLTTAAEFGFRGFTNKLTPQQRGKFVEYKDVPSGIVVPALFMRYAPGDGFRSTSLSAWNVGQLDQSLHLRTQEPGLYDVRLDWDRILHTYSTDGRSLYSVASPGVLTLPNPRPDSVAFNNAPYLPPIRSLWDPVKLSVGVSPSQQWDFKADFTRIAKSGDMPASMTFRGSSGPASEFASPIDQTVSDMKLSESYAVARYQLMASYDLSVFQEMIQSVTVDNPQVTTDAAAQAARGRMALPPSNVAHTGSVIGGLNLPSATRITAAASYSTWRQNARYIPGTVNTAITNPLLAQNPTSLGADARTAVLSGGFTSRPFRNISVSAHYRSYDFHDDVTNAFMPIVIVADRAVDTSVTVDRMPYTRTNGDANLRWRVLSPVALTFGYDWNGMKRDPEVRDRARVSETSPHVSLDLTGVYWASLRATYTRAWRRGSEYTQQPEEDNQAFRRFDEADRNRESTSLMATFTPMDQLIFSGSWDIGHDEYVNSAFGLQSDRSAVSSGDVAWMPSERFTAGASLTREMYDNRLQSQYRSGDQLNNPTYIYVNNNQDLITTTALNFTAVLVPDQWDAGGSYELSRAHVHIMSYNPQTPSGGAANRNTAALAYDFPAITQDFQPVNLFVRYRFAPDWAFTVRYQGELFTQNNYETNTLKPSTASFVLLANNYQNYDARYFTFTFSFHPGALHIGRPTL